ncbi:MAG: hypothetical protein KDB46_04395 [Solirubrobacterales bacterium]|nr:hypothetical protein [Solirubrobacterales bacterium]
MESSQTPPPSGGPIEPPPRAPTEDVAGVGPRIGAGVLALVLALVAFAAVATVIDVGDKGVCGDLSNQSRGFYECYDFSNSVKPVVVGAGWIGGVLAGIAAILALAFAVRGRGARVFLGTTASAAVFLAISIVAAQI